MIDITKEIKKMMLDRDMTQSELAEKLGISQSNLAQKLKRNNFTTSDMKAIAKALRYKLKIKFIKEEE